MQTINYFCRFIISVNTSLYANHQLFLSFYYVSQYQSVCKQSTISLFLFRQSIPVCMKQSTVSVSLFRQYQSVCKPSIISVSLSCQSIPVYMHTINYFCPFISSIPVCMQTINYFCLFIMAVNTLLYANHQLFLSL